MASAQLTAPTRSGETGRPDGIESAKKVDVNRASLDEICRSLGVSREVGQRIIRQRPYKRLDDLVSKRTLGRKQFALIRENISVVTEP